MIFRNFKQSKIIWVLQSLATNFKKTKATKYSLKKNNSAEIYKILTISTILLILINQKQNKFKEVVQVRNREKVTRIILMILMNLEILKIQKNLIRQNSKKVCPNHLKKILKKTIFLQISTNLTRSKTISTIFQKIFLKQNNH